MKKISVVLLIMSIMLAALIPMNFVFASASITVLYECPDSSTTSNFLRANFQVKNTGSSTLDLTDVTIKYWYTNEDEQEQQFNCDWADVGSSNITGTFYDGYVEIGFTSSAGSLSAGQTTGEIQTRINKVDWSNYDQSDDYSFDSTFTDYGENEKVTGYVEGVLCFGTQPDGTQVPTSTPTPTPDPNVTPTPTPVDSSTTPTDDDWLHVEGNTIVDEDGNPVWLTGTNWFGYNTGTNCFDGIWSCNMKEAIDEMANRGINLLRVPISTELIYQWSQGVYPEPNYNDYVNPELEGLTSLEIFDTAIEDFKSCGMKIMIDVHSAETNGFGHYDPLWYTDEISADIFFEAWEWMAERYKNDDTIIAFDLENEPHGLAYQDLENSAIWDDSDLENNWKAAAEECANRILAINPNVLIVVEGIESYPKEGYDYTSTNEDNYYCTWWGGNLRAVANYPLDLGENQDQLVYSPHDYGPAVYQQDWFYDGFTKDTLYNDVWRDNWAYIMEDDIAPLLIGEWGGYMDGGDNEKWMEAIRDYIAENHIHHTFWCFNANSGDTGGLVDYDFTTWDEDKYNLLKAALWQNSGGTFVGLDHVKGLGEDGITVVQYYENGGEDTVPAN